jgi:hypothetical protein
MSISRAFSTYPPGYPAREPSAQVAFTELPIERERERDASLPEGNVRCIVVKPEIT